MSNDYERMYDDVLDSFLGSVEAYADLSLKVRDGVITPSELVTQFDNWLAPVAALLLMLDDARRRRRLSEKIDTEVEKFRQELDGMDNPF